MGTSTNRQAGACEVNVGEGERVLSLATGAMLGLWGLRRINSFGGLAALGTGAALLLRGATGHCSLYAAIDQEAERRAGRIAVANVRPQPPQPDLVDESGDESFPASDAPAWTTASASRSCR